MKKKYENAKLSIEKLILRRYELLNLREQEKIDLINGLDLSNLFSMMSYLSKECLSDVKAVLKKNTSITEELASLNQKLLDFIPLLKELKEEYSKELYLLEGVSGKKRIFNKSNKKVMVSEKVFTKYSNIYNTCLDIDKLENSIMTILNEKTDVQYRVCEEEVKNLSNEEKCKYYSSLAALIMADRVSKPTMVSIHDDVCVDESNRDALTNCYKLYRETRRALLKENKKSSFRTKFNKKISNIKKYVKNIFFKKDSNKVNLALRKSFVAASLSLSFIASSAAIINSFGSSLKSNNVRVGSQKETSLSEKELNDILNDLDFNSINFTTSLNRLNNNIMLKEVNDSAPSSDTDKYVSTCSNVLNSQDIPLDERVEENASEIVAVVQTDKVDYENEGVQTFDNVYPLNEDLTVLETPVSTGTTLTSDIMTLSEDSGEYETNMTVSSEVPSDIITAGFHLTFNNTTYEFSEDEIKALYYVVKHECNGSYQDALVVVSVIINRLEDPRYPDDLISVLSAPGQFVVWEDVLREISKYGSDYEMNENIYNALYDCLYRGVRNNDYVEFKASWTSDKTTSGEVKIQIAENGNKCHNLAVSLDRTNTEETDDEIIEESKALTLTSAR